MLKQTNVSIFFSYKSISLLIIDNTTQHNQHMIIDISMNIKLDVKGFWTELLTEHNSCYKNFLFLLNFIHVYFLLCLYQLLLSSFSHSFVCLFDFFVWFVDFVCYLFMYLYFPIFLAFPSFTSSFFHSLFVSPPTSPRSSLSVSLKCP